MNPSNRPLARLLREKRVLVCCGAGGVGKTTTAAALALAAARMGRRVLVLTIDPSKRLAETLGVSRNPPAPVAIPEDRTRQAGIQAPAFLETWMLDPKVVSDEAVRRLITDPAEAEKVMQNRVYQQVTSMVAGMHEYTAMESLHRLVQSGRYDLVVLDTPPSRNALDFLDSPGRLSKLLEGRIFKLFLPREGGLVARAASSLIDSVLGVVFGKEFAAELTLFFQTFSRLFATLGDEVVDMREFLSRPDTAFLLVTSPAEATVTEALFFRSKAEQLHLPFAGFVLNRSRARLEGRRMPGLELLGATPTAAGKSAIAKLQLLAEGERAAANRDVTLLRQLEEKAGVGGFAAAVPYLPRGADDMTTLLTVADALTT